MPSAPHEPPQRPGTPPEAPPAGRFDALVLGGGPAGSAFAGIVKKYAPDLRVGVLEKARFPRWRIGESTIPVANAVLRDLDVHDALIRSQTVKKIGITFIWGRDRTPWNADYLVLRDAPGHSATDGVLDVVGQDFRSLTPELGRPEEPFTAFNVRRSEFDALLLDRARARGVEVFEGTRAVTALRDGDRVSGVAFEDDTGRRGEVHADFVLDAMGLASLFTRGQRRRDPHMNNFAVYGYLRGAGWKVTYNGGRDRTTVFIAAVPTGWIWYFPIGDDVMSVGAVTHRDHFADRLKDVDLESFFWEMLRSCPEVAGLVEGASLRDDVLPRGARVGASRDWASWAETPAGPGWAAAGDAAAFVDPILSSGVTMALQSGHRAAYTLLTARARPDLDGADLWAAYTDYVRGEAGAFLQLARFFYGNNRAAESWWWEAQRLVNRGGRLRLNDQTAFTMATAGFFPFPRAIGLEIVGPLIGGALGSDADLSRVHLDDGLPDDDTLLEAEMTPVVPFRLGIRTEPTGPTGRLEVFWDLCPIGDAMVHRFAAAPTRIGRTLAPVVAAMGRTQRVRALVDATPGLLPPGTTDAAGARRSALALVRAAARKGLLRITLA